MKDEILKNLVNVENIDDLMNLDTETYIKDEYNKLFNEWKKEFAIFDIPNTIISISINGNTNYFSIGPHNKDTIFDIASMSKLYTEMILFDVLDEYNIDINSTIGSLVSFYKNISDLTLLDLISFNNTYLTTIDIRKCDNKIDALNALRTSYIVKEKQGFYLYTDLPIMILTDILETITNKSYYELFEKYIINKHNFKKTYLILEDNSNYVTNNKNYVNDPKANIFGGYYGHAGVKTTSEEFIMFLNTIFDSKYKYLFTTLSKTKNINYDKNGVSTNDLSIEHLDTYNKAIIGNFNINHKYFELNDYKFSTLCSYNLPLYGFAVQGSVRCQGETCIFNINNKEYRVSVSIFNDLYTQVDNATKYEKETNNIIKKDYYANNNHLCTTDIRNVLPYNTYYKKLLNIIGNARIIELVRFLGKNQ